MAEEKRRFKVQIGNQTYTIVGAASAAHMQAVSRVVNDQLTQIKAAGNLSTETAATLLAINTASKQLKLQAQVDALMAQVKALKSEVQ